MAWLEVIHSMESRIIETRLVVQQAHSEYVAEQGAHAGKLADVTRDSWGTLWSNAQVLRTHLNSLLETMRDEFGAF
jgi:hypothetical protein